MNIDKTAEVASTIASFACYVFATWLQVTGNTQDAIFWILAGIFFRLK